jgi:Helix-turn-helix domain/Bacterial regulatory proteins, gntR family
MPGSAQARRYVLAAETVRAQIAAGTLRPGMPAPSGAALARVTGYGVLTCRKALDLLVADGSLQAGPSPNARPRVAGSALSGLDVSAARLSGAMVARRWACGLTQAELAGAAGFSVTAVGHAETGRLWQSRAFWEAVDRALGAAGELARLHEDYTGAIARPADPAPPLTGPAPAPAVAPGPLVVTITWPDGTTTAVRQPPPADVPERDPLPARPPDGRGSP